MLHSNMVDDEAVGTELLGGWRLSSPLLDRIQTPLGIRTSLSRRRRSRTSESFSTFHYLREARTSTLFCYLLFLSDSVFHPTRSAHAHWSCYMGRPMRRDLLYIRANRSRVLSSFSATSTEPDYRRESRAEARCRLVDSTPTLAKGK